MVETMRATRWITPPSNAQPFSLGVLCAMIFCDMSTTFFPCGENGQLYGVLDLPVMVIWPTAGCIIGSRVGVEVNDMLEIRWRAILSVSLENKVGWWPEDRGMDEADGVWELGQKF